MMARRKKGGYFEVVEGAPGPLVVSVKRRVKFSEADVMGVAWYGRYPIFFEEGAAEIGRLYGLSYNDFYKARLRAPIVQFHIDYFQPLRLGEVFTIVAKLVWSESARLNTEYELIKEDGELAAAGYTIQMFTDAVSGNSCLVSPEILEKCRRKWKTGEFTCQG